MKKLNTISTGTTKAKATKKAKAFIAELPPFDETGNTNNKGEAVEVVASRAGCHYASRLRNAAWLRRA